MQGKSETNYKCMEENRTQGESGGISRIEQGGEKEEGIFSKGNLSVH